MDFWLFLAFFCGIIATHLFYWAADKRAKSILAKSYQQKGVAVKQEDSVRLMAFLAEMKAAYEEESASGAVDVKSFAVKKALPIALKYPDVVSKHGKKLWEMLNNGKKGGGTSNFLEGGLGGMLGL